MSTPADLLHDVSELIHALTELLKTDTLQALVAMARDFGIGQPVKAGLQLLSQALGLVIRWIQTLEQVAALPAFLDALGPALDELKSLTANASAHELRDAGFDALVPVADSAQAVLGLMDKLRRGAKVVLEGVLPAQALKELRESVQALDVTLKAMQQQLEVPASAAPRNALVQGGTT